MVPSTPMTAKLLVANRGEIAVRIIRAAADLGIATVAVYAEDDALSLPVRMADEAVALRGRGAAAYLDIAGVVEAATQTHADSVHPGYGFLAENAAFATACAAAGITFVGPTPDTLVLFGDKTRARALAAEHGVAILRGTSGPTTLDEATAFLADLGANGAVMVKAIAGGGGRGMRAVTARDQLAEAFTRCASEAQSAFGNGGLYVEQLVRRARHIEVQIVGDGQSVTNLGERECTIQRRNQKLIEIAPSPNLDAKVRAQIIYAAEKMAMAVGYRSLGTFEFLVDSEAGAAGAFFFVEANPRIQVEHTVTEQVTGVDLVQAQLRIAAGASLTDVGLGVGAVPPARGMAMQLRVNMETMSADGSTRPSGGVLTSFDLPTGPTVRVDTFGYTGYRTSPNYDSLLAKVIVRTPTNDFAALCARGSRALGELGISGVATNASFLRAILDHEAMRTDNVSTAFIDEHLPELVRAAQPAVATSAATAGRAGVVVDTNDPLAVLVLGRSEGAVPTLAAADDDVADGLAALRAPMQGTIITVRAVPGTEVRAGDELFVMEAMKMEHVIAATVSGTIRSVGVSSGETVFEDHILATIEEHEVADTGGAKADGVELDHIRPDLEEVHERQAILLDAQRPDAVARRRKTNQRTTRENLADLVDEGSFTEYGGLTIAAQRRRRDLDDLINRTQADGLVGGIGRVNGATYGDDAARCVVVSYDYTVLAGTQGGQNHRKKDRLFELAEKWKLPVVLFSEGGGGRPGDTDGIGGTGLDCMAFAYFAGLSALVPLIGINSGRCFAGNAALLGCCDVVIATQNSNIGMGGPAMIEGGGLGVFRPDDIGPMSVQTRNGVVDVAVKDEAEAVAVAKQYLSYFQGAAPTWDCADQRLLRHAIPENRLRAYDIRSLITTLADSGSVLELKRHFGNGMVTSLARIEGRPVGIIANNPSHLGGAIDSDGADKAARFMQICDAFDIPILFLCDTPGMMVGPEVEKTALVRHCSRLFVTGASLTVPFFTIVLRKGYGLGAQAMAGGSFKAGLFTVAWPTGEFGGMGLEGAVKLGYRNELAAVEDPVDRKAMFDKMVARMYEHGKAISEASYFEIDDVIDPIDSRRLIVNTLRSVPAPAPRTHKKRACIDAW